MVNFNEIYPLLASPPLPLRVLCMEKYEIWSRERSWHILKYSHGIFLGDMREIMKISDYQMLQPRTEVGTLPYTEYEIFFNLRGVISQQIELLSYIHFTLSRCLLTFNLVLSFCHLRIEFRMVSSLETSQLKSRMHVFCSVCVKCPAHIFLHN
jgi:hypothetical protein